MKNDETDLHRRASADVRALLQHCIECAARALEAQAGELFLAAEQLRGWRTR
jgi:hypothetical protein